MMDEIIQHCRPSILGVFAAVSIFMKVLHPAAIAVLL
jgi:hypothetical protein